MSALFDIQNRTKSTVFFLATTITICILGTLILLPGIFDLTFFRHTEADRALIGWAMLEDRNLIVPHLLGDKYLTKPPLFYILIALSYSLFGTVAEWTARMPSVVAGVLLLLTQFHATRILGYPLKSALLSTFILGSTASFYRYGAQSEIDMVFTTVCTIANYLLLISGTTGNNKPNLKYLLAAYFMLSMGLLVKGPPALLFFSSILISLFIFRLRFYFTLHVLCGILACMPALMWLCFLAYRTSWDTIVQVINEELIQRVVNDASSDIRPRDAFFYFYMLPLCLMPWSALYVMAFSVTLFTHIKKNVITHKQTPSAKTETVATDLSLEGDEKNINLELPINVEETQSTSDTHTNDASKQVISIARITFVIACATMISLLICSLSSGKSSRYIFPLLPFCSLLIAQGLLKLANSYSDVLLKYARLFLVLLGVLTPFALLTTISFFIYGDVSIFSVIPWNNLLICNALVIFLALFLTTIPTNTSWWRIATLTYLYILTIRTSDILLVTPYQNEQHKVTAIAEQLLTSVPPGKTLYTIELFERWLCFYYMQGARDVKRLTPELVNYYQHPEHSAEDVYLLINSAEEQWRIDQLKSIAPGNTKILHTMASKTKEYLLVRTVGHALAILNPRELFPTNKTIPPVTS